MFRVLCLGVMGFAALVLGARSATAQSVSDPPPAINGDTPSKVIYTTSGVFDSATNATIVACTSTQKTGGSNVLFAVEFFADGALQNDVTVGDGDSTLTPGDTDIISTRAITNVGDTPIAVAPGIGGTGAARVLANSTAIICSAHIVEVATGDYQTSLPMFKKAKQAGD